MAPPAGTLRVGRYFLALLAILAVLYGIVFWPGQRHTPKLGLDLVGGQQVTFTAKTDNGGKPSSSSMAQAKQIMQDRVNGNGVTEATVVIQGSDQIVVSIPGATGTDVEKLGAAAQLNFRGLASPAGQIACLPPATASSGAPSSGASTSGASASASSAAGSQPSPSAPASGAALNEHVLSKQQAPLAAATTPATTTATATTPAGSTPASGTPTTATPSAPTCTATAVTDAAKAGGFTVPLNEPAYDKLTQAQQTALTTALGQFDCASAQNEKDDPTNYFVACDSSGLAYLLGPVIVPGKQISSAAAVAPNASGGQLNWTVSLSLKSSGQAAWANYTTAHNDGNASNAPLPNACGTSVGTPCADYVGFTLDGTVISAPVNQSAINGQATQITGTFTQSSANELANQLKYGALPLSFTAQDAQQVSATLGSAQLKSGLLAGGIGLILVVIYSLIYYRALGLVTISSLLVSGGLTYGALVMLGTQIGFTLSLAGIAGFIVAVGITADSFVVFFERIKDEVHEGRSMRVAIPRAWVRARRTILSADTVSFLAAAILYYFAAGDVQGFAFTLGLSTLLDLAVVFLFTHPLISWLSRFKAFGSARFTGLNAAREGGIVVSEQREPVRRANTPKRAGRASTSVAVLEPEADTDTETAVEDAPTVVDDTPVDAAPVDDATEPDAVEAEDEPADEGRRRSTPEPGSAAERAAARRARQRQQRDQKGKS